MDKPDHLDPPASSTRTGRTDAPSRGASAPLPEATVLGPRPVFWKELYWFVLILLGAWIAALLILPPRLARNRKALELERELKAVVTRLEELEAQYEGTISGLENDPPFRWYVYRQVLRAKQNNESFVKIDEEMSDN